MSLIQIIKHTQVDFAKWNLLVDNYAQGLPYAYSWYLDAVCDNWYVCIYDDYQAGFAFQIKKKYGLSYALQPFLTQQLGFLGADHQLFDSLLSKVEERVFYYDFQINSFNGIYHPLHSLRNNYELQLNQDYNSLFAAFKTNTKRNLKKASSESILVTKSRITRPEEVQFILENSKISFDEVRKQKLNRLLLAAEENDALEINSAFIEDRLVALVVYIKTKKRFVYLIAASNPKGIERKANFLLVDEFIKEHAEQNFILDFEGSNIPGVARFYDGFGAHLTEYSRIRKWTLKNSLGKLFNPK